MDNNKIKLFIIDFFLWEDLLRDSTSNGYDELSYTGLTTKTTLDFSGILR